MTTEERRIALMLALMTDQIWRPRYDPQGEPYMWLRVDETPRPAEQQKPESCFVEPIGGKVGDVPRCAKYPDCPCGGPPPHPTDNGA